MRIITTLLLTILVSSCAVRNIQDSSVIQDGRGILLIKLSTNYNEAQNGLLDNMKLSFKRVSQNSKEMNRGFVEIISPGDYKILSLPAGTYNWGKIYMGRLYIELDKNSVFKIDSGTINYLGDVFAGYKGKAWGLKPHYINIHQESNEEDAIEYLKNNYPQLLKNNIFQPANNVIRLPNS